MKTYTEFITEARRRSGSHIDLSPLGKAVIKGTAKLAWKATKAGAKAAGRVVRNYGKTKPVGTKRRAVADTLDKIRRVTLSPEERRRRDRKAARQQRRIDKKVNRMRTERERDQRPTQNRGRYRNAGAGRRETVSGNR